jgi:putative transposase
VVGIDRGIANTLATSDGRMFRVPVMRRGERRRVAALQRQQERQRKRSNRRRKTKQRIAAIHQTVADRRRNWIEVQSTRLVRAHDLISRTFTSRAWSAGPSPSQTPNATARFYPTAGPRKQA